MNAFLLHLVAWLNPYLVQESGRSFWMPVQGSTTAAEVDWLFYFIMGVSIVFFALIVGLMLLFVFRYRRKAGKPAEGQATHNTTLEIVWSVIPLLLVGIIFYFGFKSYMKMAIVPENAYEVLVTGQKWKWLFTYPNGYVDENLHVPYKRPIRLVMTSEDVIHSFFIPAFRVKRDVVPGRYAKTWFEATKTGEFLILCAEYCGTSHSDMLAKVIVHPSGQFETWLKDAANFLDRVSPAEGGKMLYKSRGCKQCHSVDGSAGIGPSFKGIYNKPHVMRDGTKRIADENYLRQSIVEPMRDIVAGYEPVMPTYKGRLTDQEITALIEYIKTLRPAGKQGSAK